MLQMRYAEGDPPKCRYRRSVSFPFSGNKGYSRNPRRFKGLFPLFYSRPIASSFNVLFWKMQQFILNTELYWK